MLIEMNKKVLIRIIVFFTIILFFGTSLSHASFLKNYSKKINISVEYNSEAPYPPSKPEGEIFPRAFIWHDYTTSCIHPQGDQLFIHYDFGDGYTTSHGPFASGEKVTISYAWEAPGDYELKASAISFDDGERYESDWSEPLVVHVQEPYLYPPDKPRGISRGVPNKEYEFSTNTIDPQNDKIWYKWNFTDGYETNWIGPYNSEETCTVQHSWEVEGLYTVAVKA